MDDSNVLGLGPLKASKGMRESLTRLYGLLLCPLCGELFDQPATLASCAHSFCMSCIDEHCADSAVCPAAGCAMPMSIVGGHGGSYRKINPQLSQMVESLKLICRSLNQAPDNWWKCPSASESIRNLEFNPGAGPAIGGGVCGTLAAAAAAGGVITGGYGVGGDTANMDDEDNGSSDEEQMIDLQKYDRPRSDSQDESDDED